MGSSVLRAERYAIPHAISVTFSAPPVFTDGAAAPPSLPRIAARRRTGRPGKEKGRGDEAVISWPDAKCTHKSRIVTGNREYHVEAFIHCYVDGVKFDGEREGIWK